MQIPGYTLIKKINSGGMATVYLATQHSIGRTLALKVIKPALDKDPEFHKRFQLEATIVGQLSHPNIIPIYDIGRHEGFNYISMEFLPKGSLEQKIAEGIPAKDAIKIMLGIAAALEHAHTKGYVHRDIKPENILFRADDSPVLTDFGIARTIKSHVNMTQVGVVIGTPLYMSPEQAKGEASDGRADLYSLGIVFYEMLTGSRPFQADCSLALGIKHIHERAPKLPLKFFTLQPVLDKLLAKKAEDRYQSGRELITALEQLTLSPTSLIASLDGKHHSLQLLKTVTLLLVKDGCLYAKKIWHSLERLKYIGSSGSKKIVMADGGTPEFMEAKTEISARSITPEMFNQYRHKHVWIYSSISLLILLLVSISIFRGRDTAVANTQMADLSNAVTATSETFPAAKSALGLVGLTINPTPTTARIRILNIKENYRPGIALAPGTYHLEVSQQGYITQTQWIDVKNDNLLMNITLSKKESPQNALPLPEMILINAGEFLMGNPGAMRKNSVKKVFLDARFHVGRYEITFNEYDYFAIATNRALPDDNGWGRGNQPVINISWDDAISYTHWLSKTTGQNYRLASAAEWEYAARGNTTSNYWWGNNEDDAVDRANCRFGCRPLFSGLFNNQTQPVGSYPPNDFGLYDTAGNVAEWIDDCSEPKKTQTALACQHRSTRGGSYADRAADISAFSETEARANEAQKTIGFRVVRAEEKAQLKNIFKRIFSKD